MQKTVYIMCDDCNYEYCVNVINDNGGNTTPHIAQADIILQHGALTRSQQSQLKYAQTQGKRICTIQDISAALKKGKGLRPKEINFDLEI